MTNYEKYHDEIFREGLKHSTVRYNQHELCQLVFCSKCQFYKENESCFKEKEKWLWEECKEVNRSQEYISKEDFERFLLWNNIKIDKIPFPTVKKDDVYREFIRERDDKVDLWKIESVSDFREEFHKAERMVLAEISKKSEVN